MAANHFTGPFLGVYGSNEDMAAMSAWSQEMAKDWHASAVADLACDEVKEAALSQFKAAHYAHRARHGMGLRPEDYDNQEQ